VIEVNGTLQPNDYVRAQFLNLRPRPVYKVVGVILLAAAIWAGWYSFSQGDIELLDYLFVAAILFLILNFAVYLPWKTRRIYKQQKAMQRELTYRFDESGVFASNENGQSTTPWEDYLKWKQNDHMILLYLSDCLYHMIPKTLFHQSDDFDKLLELVKSKVERRDA